MKKSIKLLGATALLAMAVPISAYAATSHQANTPATTAPTAAVATQGVTNNVEAPGTEVPDATENAATAPDAEVADATENNATAPDAEVADAAEASKAPEAADPNEQAKLQQAAKITQQQATDAALKQVNGTVKKVELEDENGAAVYGVQIVDANNKGFDVKVDAATGKVTKAESDNNEN